MKETDEAFAVGLARLNAMLRWWGVPHWNGIGDIDAHIKRFHVFASNLQKTYGEACRQQIDAVLAANERLTGSFQEFLRYKEPRDVLAAGSDILATLLEDASQQAKTRAEVAQRVHACCIAMTGEGVEKIRVKAKKQRGSSLKLIGPSLGTASRQGSDRPPDTGGHLTHE